MERYLEITKNTPNKEGGKGETKLKTTQLIFSIKGERATGTRVLRAYLNKCFNPKYEKINQSEYDSDGYYGWKHGYIKDEEIEKINKDKTKVIVIQKNIYAWLLSLYQNKHEDLIPSNGYPPTLLEWIQPTTSVYEPYTGWMKEFYKESGIYANYENLYELRYQKYKSFLNSKVENLYFLRYEDLIGNPKAVMEDIALHFEIEKPLSHLEEIVDVKTDYYTDPTKYYKYEYYLKNHYLREYTEEMKGIIDSLTDRSIEETIFGYNYK